MASVDVIQNNPFLTSQLQWAYPQVQGTPKVSPYQGGNPRIGGQQATSAFKLPENINLNPQLSFLRGEALTNMPLGKENAVNGISAAKLNVVC